MGSYQLSPHLHFSPPPPSPSISTSPLFCQLLSRGRIDLDENSPPASSAAPVRFAATAGAAPTGAVGRVNRSHSVPNALASAASASASASASSASASSGSGGAAQRGHRQEAVVVPSGVASSVSPVDKYILVSTRHGSVGMYTVLQHIVTLLYCTEP